MSCFKRGYEQVKLFKQKNGEEGLYSNQIGAIGSAMAHFSTRKEPGLITMPTGTGKTAVMVVLSYVLRANKILVITPSQLVREQIVGNFRDPKLLVNKGIIPGGNNLPKVYELTKVIQDKKEWTRIIKEFDVVVAIPGTLNRVKNLTETIGCDTFDLIFVDEAHHSRANSWVEILQVFSSSKQILLTATPFRRDKKDIRARLIYNYPLKQAYEDKLFSRINFVSVNTHLHSSSEEKNIAIAKKAQEIYDSRAHSDHRIIIRTDRKIDADQLFIIYSEHTRLKLIVIHSKLGTTVIKSRIKQLTTGQIDGVICVDMMGEGYDFPALKIAVVHIPHKSLAITLQFVGRISRTNTAGGSVATLIAGEHEFKIDSHQLYKQDSKDWSVILPDLHKIRTQMTADEQEFFDSFEDVTEPQPPVALQYEEPISIDDDDLRPFFHAKVYKIFFPHPLQQEEDEKKIAIDISQQIDFSGIDAINNPIVRHHHVSQLHNVAVHVVSEQKTPSWYKKDDKLKDIKNEFFLIYFNQDHSILFIGATLKETELYERIAVQYLKPGTLHDMIPMPILKRVMAGWKDPKMYNVGLRSRKTKGNSESYKQILGSQAQLGVLPADKYSYTRGHSFGGAFDTVLQKNVLLGISTSSKIWCLEENKIKYFVKWCNDIAHKVGDPQMDNLESPLSDLDSGRVVNSFPTDRVFFADWDARQYYKLTSVVFLDEWEHDVETCLICSCDLKVVNQTPTIITIEISKNHYVCRIEYSLDPRVTFQYAANSTYKLALLKGQNFGNPSAFLTMLNSNPINIFYEDLSKLVGVVLFEFKTDRLATIDNNQIESQIWPVNVDVGKEYYTQVDLASNLAAGNDKISIHEYIIGLATQNYDVVFYDHGSLEIADVIGFKNGKIKFWHCKKQSGQEPNCSISDMYEVCGQAVKSVNWANRKLLQKQICDRADQNDSSAKIKKGTLDQIKIILDSFDNPIIPVEITIVHPGLKSTNQSTSQKAAYARIKVLLSAAESFIKDVSSCKLSIMCS